MLSKIMERRKLWISAIGSTSQNSKIWHPTLEWANDFGDFMIRICRTFCLKSFEHSLDGIKAEFRPSDRRFRSILLILWSGYVEWSVISRFQLVKTTKYRISGCNKGDIIENLIKELLNFFTSYKLPINFSKSFSKC